MTVCRMKPVSFLALLCGASLLCAVSTATAMEASMEAAAASLEEADLSNVIDEPNTTLESETTVEDEEEEEDYEDEEDYVGEEHSAVLEWLRNRANFAERHHFRHPYKNYKEENGDDYQFQNGFYFSEEKLRLATNDNDLPYLVASRDIPKGTLLVGVPSDSFVYEQPKPTYKLLHPCDVASVMLNVNTYRYPSNGEEHQPGGLPALEDFVRPFLDSIMSMGEEDDGEKDDEDRHLWSLGQLESLTEILGNELDPKANTLGLWGDANATSATNNGHARLCQHPSTNDKEKNKVVDHFLNADSPNAEHFLKMFRSTVTSVVTRSWNHRMVPIYHWIARSEDFNAEHSEHNLKKSSYRPDDYYGESEDSGDAPIVYEIHASRDIRKGEEIILPYHSVAQKFAIEGKIGRSKEKDAQEDTKYRFWTQTLHDQWGTDYLYASKMADPYNDYLMWDYYPKTQTIQWVRKAKDTLPVTPVAPKQTLRATQRNILQAQYLRLIGMEQQVKELLASDPENAGNQAIVEYHELWVESLGLLLANSRPNRNNNVEWSDAAKSLDKVCKVDEGGEGSCSAPTGASETVKAYDDLRERFNGDPVDYNRFRPSHDCSETFQQTIYDKAQTPYARLEWTRSYVGGGAITDHRGDPELENADEREQDTCLHLEDTLHSCLAFRPHVHEILIHYPASFLPKNGMKRVLYVGGGDLVLLHELLRYESIELVIGMDIDQMVLRDSFRHYGIQPKFEDDRVHWWFGDAAKSLTLLPPEEYFGTFDMVLIDLVVEIFDTLRVGDHSERLVDYMAKLLKPEGILVRQEDYPHHRVVDFAKYTVDLQFYGLPHICSQSFTMGSNAIDFANHERVDHELKDLVLYEPNVDSRDHSKLWGDYRNNLDPPKRVCEGETKKSVSSTTNVLPSKGLFVAIELENLTINLGDLDLVQATMTGVLQDLGFSDIFLHNISVGEPLTSSSILYVFEEGYLAIRSFPEINFASMDLQLWNENVSKQEIVTSTLVGAIGGDVKSDSTSTFFVTTGGMFGNNSSMENLPASIVPSTWCKGDDSDTEMDLTSTTRGEESLAGLGIVGEQMLTNLVDQEDYLALVLCPDESSPCQASQDIKFGRNARVFSFHACPSILENGDEKSLNKCQEEMRATITEALSQPYAKAKKIKAIVIDSEAPRELGQIASKLFVTDPSSYHWLTHDFVLLAPSAFDAATASSGYPSSWRYQLLERFRTDMIEFHPVYHATVSLRHPSSKWAMGILSAGNPQFYGRLMDSMDAIRENSEKKIEEVILVETKAGAVSHIPDYQPSKWATTSDYDTQPAEEQYKGQRAVGVQLLVQHEALPDVDDLEIGDKILFFDRDEDNWVAVSTYYFFIARVFE